MFILTLSIIRISVAHSSAWVHEWSDQKLHKMFCLIILAHVLFIWADNIYMGKTLKKIPFYVCR